MAIEVVCALIGFGGSVVGSVIGIFANAKLTHYRLEQLEKEVQKHNNLVERVYKLEQDTAVQGEKIAVANHRIDDLERSQNG